MTHRYAVMGDPIAHSKSPRIHALFARQTRQDIAYDALRVPLDGLKRAIEEFREGGGAGLNITLPLKEKAWSLASFRTPRCERAGAVNTLWFDAHGGCCGDNTDGAGLLRDLTDNQGMDPAGRCVLVLGAGGAARGVLGPLLDAGPASLTIANRTPAKAEWLARAVGDAGCVDASTFEQLAHRRFDLVINATSASLKGVVPPLPDDLLADGACCYDMMYGENQTPFLKWGEAHGAGKFADGLGMLVEQAAESFLRWRGVRPETPAVIAALRTAR